MTDTTITAPVQHGAGVLEHLDPARLVIETNVRTEGLILDAGFVDSVGTHGVLVPVLGWRDTDGTVHVRAGQRRTLAAREAQVVSIPVYVVQAEDDGTRCGSWSSWSRTSIGGPSPALTASPRRRVTA